ncbi:MAG: PTS mannose/fructose/sorbose/N-acetylgalactosamine transporter subunit IIC [Erysipelotrichaceae bacterium]
MVLVLQATLLGILAGLGQLDSRIFGQNMLDRPLILGPIVGLILGDVGTGIIMGGSLELIFMGFVGIGVSTPADTNVGGILGTAFAILSGLEIGTAVTLALPIAMLANFIGIFVRTVNSAWQHRADKFADEGNAKGVARTMWYGAALFFICPAIVVFLGVIFGSDAANYIVSVIPDQVMDGLRVASGVLPAIGLALLLDITFDKKYIGYLALGFVLVAVANINSITVAVIGAIIAVIVYFLKDSLSAKKGDDL